MKLTVHKKGEADNYYTPTYAVDYLLPYLPKDKTIWECACGNGNISTYLSGCGYNVVGTDVVDGVDFLTQSISTDWDMIVTNPPYSMKNEFVMKCYEYGKPFALLMPVSALETEKRQRWYRERGVQLLIPNRRIKYTTPGLIKSSPQFLSVWVCWGLLPTSIVFAV